MGYLPRPTDFIPQLQLFRNRQRELNQNGFRVRQIRMGILELVSYNKYLDDHRRFYSHDVHTLDECGYPRGVEQLYLSLEGIPIVPTCTESEWTLVIEKYMGLEDEVCIE